MQNLFHKIQPLLRDLRKPSRYIGCEFNAPVIDACGDQFNFCMIYPDVYEIGQSNQAVRILCNCINNIDGFAAQRAFLPEPEAKAIFENNSIAMFSLETFSPLSEFDAIGITVSHELVATNILEVLDYSDIPIKSVDRTQDDCFVFGGGPMCCNPEPYHEFFDVITIGEGEVATINALIKLKELKSKGFSREEILHELAKMESIYVPSMYELNSQNILVPKFDDVPKQIKKAVYTDFSKSQSYENCIVPYNEIVHDRLNVEILRGCARGCRFCQAGIMYRPVRERSAKNICDGVILGLEETGYDEVSLVSLSSTDHSQITQILRTLNEQLDGQGVRISIPSQRLDSFGIDMAKLVAGNKKGGLTFAIEAGTQRLRDVINKNVNEQNIFDTVQNAFENGWNRAKLYFMIGLPTETDEDVIGIAILCEKILQKAREAVGDKRANGVQISVSCAVFIPKAQTPFMYDGYINSNEAMRRVNLIRKNLHSKAISFNWHDTKTSLIEAVLSRGARNCSALIEKAWENGAKFDAWNDYFNFEAWELAAKDLSLNLEEQAYMTYEFDDRLPWDHIFMGVDFNYFINERKLADKAQTTQDCTFDKCSNCGVCHNLGVNNNIEDSR